MEENIEKRYYPIGEVAAGLGESQSLIRFWSDKFEGLVKPLRTKKGNRLFSLQDIEALKRIRYLTKDQGLTLEGALKKMRENRDGTDKKREVAERLGKIREELQKIYDNI